jgi:hypothetical protein
MREIETQKLKTVTFLKSRLGVSFEYVFQELEDDRETLGKALFLSS